MSPPVRIAVGSDQSLVAEAVVVALRSRSYDALVVGWPRSVEEAFPDVRSRHASRRSIQPPPDAGLVVSDLARMEQVRGAQTLVLDLPVPWMAMGGIRRGRAWGALYESGAHLVVPSDTGLDEVCKLLDDLASGREPGGRGRGQRELVRRWRRFAAQRAEQKARLITLTDREAEVLQQLHEGMAVRMIAEQSEVSEATVRSQVKAILKKLDVNTQMAAVAAYEGILTDSVEDVATGPGTVGPG